MAYEYRLLISEKDWIADHHEWLEEEFLSFKSFVQKEESCYIFLGTPLNERESSWSYDLRIFLEKESILFEISAHHPSISEDLNKFEKALSRQTTFKKQDL